MRGRATVETTEPVWVGWSIPTRVVRSFRAGIGRIDPVVAFVSLLVVLPIGAAALQLRSVAWYPTGDLAQAELRMIRFFDHPPLVGAAGRIVNEEGVQGNHPGPAMFWALWPAWRLLGGSAWAFATSTAILNAIGAAASVWLVSRRLGRRGAIAWGFALSVLLAGFGLDALTQAWNPWVALLPFAVFVLAVWGYLDDDDLLFPVVVVAGSWCMQAHVGYIVPVPLALAVALIVKAARRRVSWKPLAAAVSLGVALWVLPLYEQLTRTPGNFSILVANFTQPSTETYGLVTGFSTTLRLLNPVGAWARAQATPTGSVLPGLAVAVAWIACVRYCVACNRRGDSDAAAKRSMNGLVRLHGVVAIGWVSAVLAISRVFGEFFIYTFRWAVIVAALMFTSIVLTVTAAVDRSGALYRFRGGERRWTTLAVVCLLALSISTIHQLSTQEIPYATGWKAEAELAPKVLAKLSLDRRYHIVWDDPVSLGGLGFGLMLAADRAGFTVQTEPVFGAGVEQERVGNRFDADEELHVVTGPAIAKWQKSGVGTRLAFVDTRTDAERAEFARTQAALFDEITAKNRPWALDTPMFAIMTDKALSDAGHRRADRLIMLGQPTAVYLAAPGVTPP